MNIAIIGYGRMGHEIEAAAKSRGHVVSLTVDIGNSDDLNSDKFRGINAAIEFSGPGSALNNILKCFEMGVPVVSGTTGWLKDFEKASEACKKYGTAFIYSSNFSIGVNILFRLNSQLAKYMAGLDQYKSHIEEIHHTKKLDAPSGTALSLVEGIKLQHPGYTGWCFENENKDNSIPVKAVREGEIPGTHIVTWDSEVDSLIIRHEAKSRKGFAVGAVVAAEFIYNKKGVFTMSDVLGF
jgi:4-hydroxy-tetrahydrodipicolinate reductase